MTDKMIIFDTTLRDGEQCPGASMTLEQKIELGLLLDEMGVDVIEAGFACSSEKDAKAIYGISEKAQNAVICSLSRCVPDDIEASAKALAPAIKRGKGRIHVFASTSPIHMAKKLKKTPEEVKRMIYWGVSYARSFTPDVEFSAEDATRTDIPFLVDCVKIAVKAGAKTINLPDTVGYSEPQEYAEFINRVIKEADVPKDIVFSTHCHNDLGMAVANSLAGVRGGARQVECSMNGLGERAGNAALEEIVMAVKTRADRFPFYTNIETQKICEVSRKVSEFSGFIVQKNKAIVGENAFAHASGIHQDGMLKDRTTYEVMNPESVGANSQIVLTSHSGMRAVSEIVKRSGFNLGEIDIKALTAEMKREAATRKIIDRKTIINLIQKIRNTGKQKEVS